MLTSLTHITPDSLGMGVKSPCLCLRTNELCAFLGSECAGVVSSRKVIVACLNTKQKEIAPTLPNHIIFGR